MDLIKTNSDKHAVWQARRSDKNRQPIQRSGLPLEKVNNQMMSVWSTRFEPVGEVSRVLKWAWFEDGKNRWGTRVKYLSNRHLIKASFLTKARRRLWCIVLVVKVQYVSQLYHITRRSGRSNILGISGPSKFKYNLGGNWKIKIFLCRWSFLHGGLHPYVYPSNVLNSNH